jgi:sulfide:quinone oxidoreductase
MGHKKKQSVYEGYSSCPIFLGDNKLMLVEFKYNGESNETFFKNQAYGSRMFFCTVKEVFPRVYFYLMPRGKWHGKDMLYPA